MQEMSPKTLPTPDAMRSLDLLQKVMAIGYLLSASSGQPLPALRVQQDTETLIDGALPTKSLYSRGKEWQSKQE